MHRHENRTDDTEGRQAHSGPSPANQHSGAGNGGPATGADVYSEDEEALVQERLKNLGYL
jgi:hypothetical protein